MDSDFSWICCQLGARQHYSVPRGLHRAGALAALITDLWIVPRTIAHGLCPSNLRDRFHPQLSDATVLAPNLSAILFNALHRTAGREGWDLMLRRNDWFQ